MKMACKVKRIISARRPYETVGVNEVFFTQLACLPSLLLPSCTFFDSALSIDIWHEDFRGDGVAFLLKQIYRMARPFGVIKQAVFAEENMCGLMQKRKNASIRRIRRIDEDERRVGVY